MANSWGHLPFGYNETDGTQPSSKHFSDAKADMQAAEAANPGFMTYQEPPQALPLPDTELQLKCGYFESNNYNLPRLSVSSGGYQAYMSNWILPQSVDYYPSYPTSVRSPEALIYSRFPLEALGQELLVTENASGEYFIGTYGPMANIGDDKYESPDKKVLVRPLPYKNQTVKVCVATDSNKVIFGDNVKVPYSNTGDIVLTGVGVDIGSESFIPKSGEWDYTGDARIRRGFTCNKGKPIIASSKGWSCVPCHGTRDENGKLRGSLHTCVEAAETPGPIRIGYGHTGSSDSAYKFKIKSIDSDGRFEIDKNAEDGWLIYTELFRWVPDGEAYTNVAGFPVKVTGTSNWNGNWFMHSDRLHCSSSKQAEANLQSAYLEFHYGDAAGVYLNNDDLYVELDIIPNEVITISTSPYMPDFKMCSADIATMLGYYECHYDYYVNPFIDSYLEDKPISLAPLNYNMINAVMKTKYYYKADATKYLPPAWQGDTPNNYERDTSTGYATLSEAESATEALEYNTGSGGSFGGGGCPGMGWQTSQSSNSLYYGNKCRHVPTYTFEGLPSGIMNGTLEIDGQSLGDFEQPYNDTPYNPVQGDPIKIGSVDYYDFLPVKDPTDWQRVVRVKKFIDIQPQSGDWVLPVDYEEPTTVSWIEYPYQGTNFRTTAAAGVASLSFTLYYQKTFNGYGYWDINSET